MKAEMTMREKIMMVFLGLLVLFCVYYFVFLIPTKEQIDNYRSETLMLDDQIIMADAKVAKMNMMKAELDAIFAGEMGEVKELPAYDNSYQVMNHLSAILKKAFSYNVSFSSVVIEDSTVRRNLTLDYDCGNYDDAKGILEEIYEGEYRCLFKDLFISHTTSEDTEGYHVMVDITYFEYN